MANIIRVGDLEIGQDLDFQRRDWNVQRVGWVIMLLLLLAALAGLFGGGPLSQGSVGSADGPLQVQYPRFGRLQTPTELRVMLGAGAVTGNEARVWLDQSFVEQVEIEHITPPPDRVELGQNRQTYVFQVTDPAQPGNVTFTIQPHRIGPLTGRLGSGDGPALSFSPFIYP